MKSLFLVLTLLTSAAPSYANDLWQTGMLQLQYSPSSRSWGDTDQELIENRRILDHYDRFDIRFDRAVAGRLIWGNTYLRASQHDSRQDEPDQASVDSLSVGIAVKATGINPNANDYFVGGLGIGASEWYFHHSDTKDREFFGELSAEYGFRLTPNVLAGTGFNYKLYGRPGETKAHWLDLYISASVAF